MHAPGLVWRGATSAPFPGYMLIGRGPDFATTLTSASGDIIDQYAETLCGGSDEKYRYKGQCRAMGTFNAGHAQRRAGQVPDHRARPGGGLRDGQRPQGRDLVEALELRQGRARPALLPPALDRRRCTSPKSFFDAAAKTPQTFNSFYIDSQAHRRVHERQAADPRPSVDPGLPTEGTGQYEWRGFLSDDKHIHGIDPARRDDGQLEQHRRPRLRRRRRQLGRQRLGRPGRPAEPQPRAPQAATASGRWRR